VSQELQDEEKPT